MKPPPKLGAQLTAEPLLVGDRDHGAFGRTLMLWPTTNEAPRWFQQRLRDMAAADREWDLAADQQVRIEGLAEFWWISDHHATELRLRVEDADTATARYFWSGPPDKWDWLSELIQPFADGRHGHQYLSTLPDDELIEFSFGEASDR